MFGMLGTIQLETFFLSLLYKNVKIEMQEALILPVVLNGRETWSLILRTEHRLRVFENRILRTVFGPNVREREAK
jgi:hypothetical protein